MANDLALKSPKLTRMESMGREKPIDAQKRVSPDRQKETAQYVADMILELRNMAKSAKLYQVMVPLEYAYYEAFSIANKVAVSEAEVERLQELTKAGEQVDVIPEDY